MGRSVILGNGRLTVGLNEKGLVHDFYYPYVGLDNLTTARSVHHKIGIWVDGQFAWIDDGWQTKVDFEADALISMVTMSNESLGVELQLSDFVDSEYNAFCRKITVVNHSDNQRNIRLFTHQVFQISNDGRADTALYVPDDHYIFDYKGRCSLLIYGEGEDGVPYDQFSVGNYGIEGKEGTYRDAEDGELAGGTVEHGGVDSVIRFNNDHQPGQARTYFYWIVAANSQQGAFEIHQKIKSQGVERRLAQTRWYWHDWLSQGSNKLHALNPNYIGLVKKSLMIIKVHADKHGGILASADSSIYNYGRDYYNYVWPRDGAYAIWPLIRLGYYDEAKRFFNFCKDVIHVNGYMMHKYQPDRSLGSTWHPQVFNNLKELPIQEDETAILVYMLGEYLQYSQDDVYVRGMYDSLIKPAADFMVSFIDEQTSLPHASYDLWEQQFSTSTYTAALTYQALLVACDLAELFDRAADATQWKESAEQMLACSAVFFDPDRRAYRKGYLLQPDGSLQFDNTLDVSSMYGVMLYNYYQTPNELASTVNLIEQELLDVAPSGGTTRYEHDNYFFDADPKYMGNPWIITTLWMAQYYIRVKQYHRALEILDWVQYHASSSGVLSEQVHPVTNNPISVAPLVWSHAEFINTVLDISRVQNQGHDIN
ncbi:MAG: glycoside hydrolase family 15 protein [Candidatus Saccharimonadales bacterium]